jgi:hypothetical protein
MSSKTIIIKKNAAAADIPSQGIRGGNAPSAMPTFGTWGKVIERHSEDHSVDIGTAEGFRITHIPVASRSWVTLTDPVLGERDLPPKDAMVFMFMPTGNVDSAFIPPFSSFIHTFEKHTEVFLQKGKEEDYAEYEGGWSKKFDKATGDLELVGTDGDGETLIITVKKSEKKIQITDWNKNDVLIDKNGISLTDTKGNKAITNDDGMKAEDKNGNKFTMDSSGTKIEDKSGNAVTMDSGGMKQEATNLLELKGKMVKAGGTAAPNGQGGWCAIPTCPYAGIPHVGDTLAGG